ncbi:DUF4342 domain-containing protein [Pelotomaculum terephthalicicum JT]|uniref:DUF4342 domain-containing protein n=1 Tax=Pelotomaculum TaxID=191373 RepID=UPI0009C9C005|nr:MULTISPECIES: DUF4342 domain-containing protein [Pelotomaculum]MCG9967056.1 DUF4342 domain-containing protein [Pelotomaculum terephthalicicum JT]OPX90497.1 MAG: hypothetical protein A4E54_00637 [Pelotomaculum sp. PtaB.Bin117]OPY63899.1 MAG: hypothetical protein A4E56_00252 [Pelotomaculum sp. PtaU1.Bin065]
MGELEKIDILRTRLGVSYKEAKAALDAADGDVLQALINLEEKEHTAGGSFHEKGSEVLGQIKGLFNKNRGYRIKVKQGERTVVEIPASLGALGLLGAMASSEIAILGVLASVAGMANKYSLDIERAGESDGVEVKSGSGGNDI